jgi:hypothetical protein
MFKYSKLLSRLFKRPVIVIEPLEPFDVKQVSQEPVIVDCLEEPTLSNSPQSASDHTHHPDAQTIDD